MKLILLSWFCSYYEIDQIDLVGTHHSDMINSDINSDLTSTELLDYLIKYATYQNESQRNYKEKICRSLIDYESNCMTRVGIARMGTLIRPKTFVS